VVILAIVFVLHFDSEDGGIIIERTIVPNGEFKEGYQM
jgi:hypothetical protein